MERRNTKQRQIILEAVQSRCDHPNAEQIFRQVRETDPKISLGTVYRNLAILAEEGKILDIRLAGADRFDLTTMPHDHFYCEVCGSVSDIRLGGTESAKGSPEASGTERAKGSPEASGTAEEKDSGTECAAAPEEFRTEDGFVIRSHQTLYRGICPACGAKNNHRQ